MLKNKIIYMLLLIISTYILIGCSNKYNRKLESMEITSKGVKLHHEDINFEESNPFSSGQLTNDISYFGEKSLKLIGEDQAEMFVDINNDVEIGLIATSAWIYLDGADLATLNLYLKNGESYELIRSRSIKENNKWQYIKTDYLGKNFNDLKIDEISKNGLDALKIEIVTKGNGTVYVDLLEVGEYQAIHGHLNKMAMVAYQPWYESENMGWGNWQYEGASIKGGENSYPSKKIDGFRNIASVYYPLIGAYDSSDEEVIEYHLKMIHAMNFDVVQVNYYGELNEGMLDTFNKLVKACEKYNLKISILYEPKIHLNGWIPHENRSESVEAITDDIINFVNKYESSKALLKYDGNVMVEIFGVNLLRNVEWLQIKDKLKMQNINVHLIGDSIGSGDYSAMLGMFHWNLYDESISNGEAEMVKNYVKDLNQKAINWSSLRYDSIPIGIVYPGFDDSKVLGWDLGVARKIESTGPNFYKAAWEGFESLDIQPDWLLVATFNDWNEGTVLEPKYPNDYKIAIMTQEHIAKFKGNGLIDPKIFENITEEYLNNRKIKYD